MTDHAYLRFPHLHGDLVTFVAEDDVWLAPLAGGRAWRVTADQVPVFSPRFDPSGTRLAWASRRDGAPEVHLAPVAGGEATRLTHWGCANTTVRGWTPQGEVVAVTSAGEATRMRRWAHALPVDGGPSRRLPYGWVGDVEHGPSGEVVVTSMYGKDPAYWKRYRGGSAGQLWVDPTGDGEFSRILSELTSSLHAPMWVGGRIAFLSDHDGVGSVYSVRPDGSDLRRHTEQDFYARCATTDGRRVVYQLAGEVWLLDGLDAEPRRLEIALGGPRSATRPRPVAPRPDDVHPDRTGRASVVEVRGTVHWVTHRDGPVRALAEQPGVRARLPRVVGDGVVWVTDADGEEGLEFAPAGGVEPGNAPRRVAVGRLGRVLELAVAPDGRRLAVATHDGRLLLVDVESGEVREVLREANPHVSDLAFSPDSNWLAWSHPGPSPLRHIRMTNTTDLSLVDVTPLRFADFAPTFTEDGRFLAFLSVRTFDPVYDAHVFDLSFPTGCRPFLLPLAATTPSPFDPLRLGRPVGDDDKDKDKEKDDENPITVVDLDGLADRVVPVPVAAAGYSSLTAAKGGLLWLRSAVSGVLGDTLPTPSARAPRPVLERFDLAKSRTDVLVDGLDGFAVTGDGQRVVVLDGSDLRVVPADRKVDADDQDSVEVDLSRLRVVVDRAAEWRQSYAEAGRLMRDLFWRTDMGGVDWAGVLDRYRPLVDRLGSYSDLVDLLWEVQGELGTSHAYVIPSSGWRGRPVGLLGADLERDPSGAWRVTRVIPGETSDPAARSPLAAPGVAVRAGDAIVAVDGRQVDPLTGPAPLLVGTAGKPVELTVRPGGGGEPRRVVVVPLEDDEPLRYHAWVADRRARTHELSDGRVGYLHVPDMMGAGWAQLHRDLRVELAREAVVLDVRENGGGHTSQLVVEKLARRIIGWSVARGYTTPDSYPADAPRGPVVAIADEFAGSDGDIVNVAIKEMGIGPVVGVRTWGGVIGIDMQFDLVDGTVVTQPRYAMWFAGHGWGVENHGVDPDVEVVMTPQDRVAGRDPQLDTAVKLALEALAQRPAAVPPQLPPLG
ncbi:S41 family peptidase [Saccharothrix algeriensis]|uniref:Tricorn protease homolog n=1 Tax=Saccharothrix algeriensis TaxID=173560 RepID=A0A8T8I371_9PSEU|nr:S41 family peptidase [Saccharothrix algeriensis]MBM7811527.1 tricorn protease [Saccharothrix algeriensis]QTR05343.1 PDZ domain-containing protein [Saccharothrix algeriensis]